MREDVPADHEVWDAPDLELLDPLAIDLTGQSVGDGVLVRGNMRTRLSRECRRCLTDVTVEINDAVDMLYEPLGIQEEDDLSGEVYPLPERGDLLDLLPALRQELLLRVPSFVICREECKGLCPQCGVDLNEKTCGCVPEEEAGPWDALKKIEFD